MCAAESSLERPRVACSEMPGFEPWHPYTTTTTTTYYYLHYYYYYYLHCSYYYYLLLLTLLWSMQMITCMPAPL